MARIIKAKYYPDRSLLEAGLGSNSSYTWHSIIWGRDLPVKGLRWKIGCGNLVRVSSGPWLPRPSQFRPITIPSAEFTDLNVTDLMSPSRWNGEKIDKVFWPLDRDLVRGIPLSAGRHDDILVRQ